MMPYAAAQMDAPRGCGFPSTAMTRKARDGFHTGEGEEKETDRCTKHVLQCHFKSRARYQKSRENAGNEIMKRSGLEDKLPPTPISQC